MIETSLTTPEREVGQVEQVGQVGQEEEEEDMIEFDVLLLYMKIKEAELADIVDNIDYQIDIYTWWDRFNEDMYVFESTKTTIEEDFELTYIRNRIELLLHLNFW